MLSLLEIDHLVLTTLKPQRLIKFYQELFDFQIDQRPDKVALIIGKQKINIHLYPSNLAPLAKNERPGGQIFSLALEKSQSQSALPVNSIYDPDGNMINISPGSPAIQNITLLASDMEATVKFYANFLDMKIIASDNAVILKNGEAEIHLVHAREREEKNIGIGDFCLLAKGEIEDIYQNFITNKAPLVPDMGIVKRTGAFKPIKSVYLYDPEGNLVEIGV